MNEVALALMRSAKTLARGRVWLLLLWPAVAALLLWIGLAYCLLDWLIGRLVEQPPLSWLAEWGAIWLAKMAAAIGGWLLILAAAFVTAMLLAAIFVMPQLLTHVAASDYPELARLGSDSVASATWNAVSGILLFSLGWLLTLPLWLVPGMALLLPIFWMAWLTRRTFAYDALAAHASDDEWQLLRRQHGLPMLLLGITLALLTHVPLLGLLTPTLAALAYIHLSLEALRHLRQGAVVTIVGQPTTSKEMK